MPKGYIIGHVTVTDLDAYKDYIAGNSPIIQAHGGRPLVRGGASEQPEGPVFERHVVFEFDSYDAAKALYNDPAYQAVAQIRYDNAKSMIVLVEGV